MARISILLFCLLINCGAYAQVDSSVQALAEFPSHYFKEVNKKIDKYSDRISKKAEKSLTKLSKWETKIEKLLRKASPAAANQLFGAGKTTFRSLLVKLKEGKDIAGIQQARFNSYRDRLNTSIKYLESNKQLLDSNYLKPLKKVSQKSKQLEADVANSEAVDKFIKERKKQLVEESIKYIGKSKYLSKINKESYYYVETIRNYKKIFSDPAKAEETAMNVMRRIPGFDKFLQKNGMIASLFGSGSGAADAAQLTGLQTRAGINNLIEDKISAGGPNAKELIQQQIQQAQAEITKLKDKVQKAGGSNSDTQVPDFKPNSQKSKTFLQRLEFESNLQFGKSSSMVPNAANIGLSVGYKLNDKSIIGLGAAYKLGMGSIDKIRFTHQGIGFRSSIDWKLKKQFFLSGGYEMNFNAGFKGVSHLRNSQAWQNSCLLGITKMVKVKSKYLKGTSLELFYDVLSNQHIPISQPIIFRTGFSFK
jgi:hypothetical protein